MRAMASNAASVAKPSGGSERGQAAAAGNEAAGNEQGGAVPPLVKQPAAPNKAEITEGQAQTEQPDPYKFRDLIAQEDMAYWAMMMFFAALATLIVTSVGTFLIWRQVKLTRQAVEDTSEATEAMREANRISDTTARRSLRPYVWPEAAWFEMMENGEPVSFVHKRNFGKTPAISLQGWDHTWLADFPLSDPLPEPDAGEVQMSNAVLGPGQHHESTQRHGLPLDERALQYIREKRAALYLYGYGEYLDTFGKQRFYRYIYFSTGEGFERGRFAPYMSGNVIDVE
jgi:hypothetical protein